MPNQMIHITLRPILSILILLYGHTLNKEIRLSRISKSFVWFDGIPGLLLDYELSNGEVD